MSHESEIHIAGQAVRFSEVTMAIYAAITLLGVIAAASWKGLFVDYPELVVLVIGTTITVAVAHLWANVAAHRLVDQRPMSSPQRWKEFRVTLSVFVVGILALVALALSWTISDDLETSVRWTIGMLILVLFVVGLVGSRRRGATWPRAVGWGCVDASIGVAVLIAKIVAGS
ncbi:MAG: hypothetical protein ACKOT0_04020 [bacterium]